LHPQVCLAWSGSLVHAQSYAEYVRRLLLGKVSISYDELRAALEAYPREDIEGHLDFVIYSWDGSGWGWFSNLVSFDLAPFVQIRAGGSGAPHLIKHIQGIGAAKLEGNLDAYSELGLRALTYASLASAQQYFGSIGLNEWWGGGFEVAVRRDDRFTKLGPICWFFWECVETAPLRFCVELLPSFMYQFYVNKTAMFWIDEQEGVDNKLHAIMPPFQTTKPQMGDRPTTFVTDIVVNVARTKMLNGDSYDGCNVDTAKGPDDRNLTITWSKEDNKTSIQLNETHLQRLLRHLPMLMEAALK
jgi:hypothetical protein